MAFLSKSNYQALNMNCILSNYAFALKSATVSFDDLIIRRTRLVLQLINFCVVDYDDCGTGRIVMTLRRSYQQHASPILYILQAIGNSNSTTSLY